MRRRDALAGVASLAVLGGSGVVLGRELAAEEETSSPDVPSGPAEIETIDATGSEAGTVTVPGDRPTVLTFFVTSCGYCRAQMAPFGEARRRIDEEYGADAARFLAVNYLNRDQESPEEVRETWEENGGDATVGYQSGEGLATRYGVITYPVTVVVDAAGDRRWKSEAEVKSAAEIVDAVAPVLEEAAGTGGSGNETAPENGSTAENESTTAD